MNKSKYLYESPAMTIVEVNVEGVICYSGDPVSTNSTPVFNGLGNEEEM